MLQTAQVSFFQQPDLSKFYDSHDIIRLDNCLNSEYCIKKPAKYTVWVCVCVVFFFFGGEAGSDYFLLLQFHVFCYFFFQTHTQKLTKFHKHQ